VIDDGAGGTNRKAPMTRVLKYVANTMTASANLQQVGTIGSGEWNGTVIDSDYLDADTAHLSTTQTFTGAKTFSAAAQFGNTVTVGQDDTGYDVQFFGDTASAYMLWDTSADDLVLAGAAGLVVPEGQLTLGATAVAATATELNYLDGFADEAFVGSADSIVFYDATDSKLKSEATNDFLSDIAGAGLSASSSKLSVTWALDTFVVAGTSGVTSTANGVFNMSGSNLTGTLSATPAGYGGGAARAARGVHVSLNGLTLRPDNAKEHSGDSVNDYRIQLSGTTATILLHGDLALESGDRLMVRYLTD